MSTFGVLDAKAMGTNVGVTNGDATVTTSGDFTSTSDNFVKVGDVLELSGVAYIVTRASQSICRINCNYYCSKRSKKKPSNYSSRICY